MNYKPHRPPDRRHEDLPASSMSWHEKELAIVQKKAGDAQKVRAISSRGSRSWRTHSFRSNTSQSDRKLSIIVVRKDEKPPEAYVENPELTDEYIQSSKEILLGENTEGSEVLTSARSSQSQWSVDEHSEVLDQRLSGFLDEQATQIPNVRPGSGNPVTKVDIYQSPKRKVIVTDKHQPPVPMLQRYYRATSAPVTPSTSVVPIQSNGYYINGRSISSYRPHSSMSVHRSRCTTPGAFAPKATITSGPHCGLDSLLVYGEGGQRILRPRSSGPLHKSAWYQVPGRYPTSRKPYPPKRSQHRINPTLLSSSVGSSAASTPRSSRTASPLDSKVQGYTELEYVPSSLY